jgi:hypothetical protein
LNNLRRNRCPISAAKALESYLLLSRKEVNLPLHALFIEVKRALLSLPQPPNDYRELFENDCEIRRDINRPRSLAEPSNFEHSPPRKRIAQEHYDFSYAINLITILPEGTGQDL